MGMGTYRCLNEFIGVGRSSDNESRGSSGGVASEDGDRGLTETVSTFDELRLVENRG